MHQIAVLTADRVHSLDLAMPLQVFSTAHALADSPDALFGRQLYALRVCGAGRDLAITGVDDVELYRYSAPFAIKAALDANTIMVVGHGAEPPRPAVLTMLRTAHERGIRIASISAGGAFVLAAAGLLDGRRAATHWSRAERLATQYPRVTVDPSVLYVDDGDVLTSAGAASGIDLCLHMIRTDFGSAVAADVARHLVVPPQRDGGQAPYIVHERPAPDRSELAPTLHWLQQRLDHPTTLAQIARRLRTSTRTTNRLFRQETGVTPLQWLLRQRVRRAQELLETTDLAIETVARHCGFATGTAMRQHFTRQVGTSPMAYRRTFRSRDVGASG